jgi:ketosteroid isomerase-like protein
MASAIKGWLLAAGLFTALLSGAADAQSAQPADEAKTLISRQLEAFDRDDAASAYALVTPGLKMTFTDPDSFMKLVRDHYAPVYRRRAVNFGDAKIDGDTMAITATLVDSENQVWTALYTLERQADGQWLINSCHLLRPLESGLQPRSRAA